MNIEQVIIWISFSLGAAAGGIWTVLGVHWFRKDSGVLRIVLVWTSIYVVANLAFRVYLQVLNWEAETKDPAWMTIHRIVLNFMVLGLGLYLAKNSDMINAEGVTGNDSRSV